MNDQLSRDNNFWAEVSQVRSGNKLARQCEVPDISARGSGGGDSRLSEKNTCKLPIHLYTPAMFPRHSD